MQLRKSETFGIFNNHYRSIRYVYSDFYHRSSHHYLCLSRNEKLHLLVFLSRFHFAMYLANLALGKFFEDMLIPLFKVLQIDLLTFLYQRINDINLTSLINLLLHRTVHALPTIVELMHSGYRLSSGRQLVNNRHIQITV